MYFCSHLLNHKPVTCQCEYYIVIVTDFQFVFFPYSLYFTISFSLSPICDSNVLSWIHSRKYSTEQNFMNAINTQVILNSSVFCDIMPFNPLIIHTCLWETSHLHLLGSSKEPPWIRQQGKLCSSSLKMDICSS